MKNIDRPISMGTVTSFAIALCWLAAAAPHARAQVSAAAGVITAVGNDVVMRSIDGGHTWFQLSAEDAARAQSEMGRAARPAMAAPTLRATLEGDVVRLSYQLERPARVRLELADMAGKIVALSNEGAMVAGEHAAELFVGRVPTGCYYCSVLSDGHARRVKVLITR